MDYSPPGSFAPRIFQARILEWVIISFSRGSSDPGIKPTSHVSPALAGGFFTIEPPGKPSETIGLVKKFIQTFSPLLYLQKQKVEPSWITGPNLLTLNVTYCMQINFFLFYLSSVSGYILDVNSMKAKVCLMTLSPLPTIST